MHSKPRQRESITGEYTQSKLIDILEKIAESSKS